MIFLLGVLLGIIGRFRLMPALYSVIFICVAAPIYYFGVVAGPAMLAELPGAVVSYGLGALISVWWHKSRQDAQRAKGLEAERQIEELLAKAEAYQEKQKRAAHVGDGK